MLIIYANYANFFAYNAILIIKLMLKKFLIMLKKCNYKFKHLAHYAVHNSSATISVYHVLGFKCGHRLTDQPFPVHNM